MRQAVTFYYTSAGISGMRGGEQLEEELSFFYYPRGLPCLPNNMNLVYLYSLNVRHFLFLLTTCLHYSNIFYVFPS
jgi:hypothetical protein